MTSIEVAVDAASATSLWVESVRRLAGVLDEQFYADAEVQRLAG